MSRTKQEALGPAMAMVVHDLRNPAATLRANLSFVREVAEDPSVPPSEVAEALDDAQLALADLMRGLDQLSWLGRYLTEQSPASSSREDIRDSVKRGVDRLRNDRVQLSLPDSPVPARGGEALSRLVEVLAVNSLVHGAQQPVRVTVSAQDDGARVEVADVGRALAAEFAESAWTLEGQTDLKSRADGRYSRVLGLFSAKLLADALDAKLEALGSDGRAVFRVTLPQG